MKKFALIPLAVFGLMAGTVSAADLFAQANVVSVTPIYVANAPQRVCYDDAQPQAQAGGISATGTIIGAVAGGLIANRVGKGNGKTAATAVGAVVGAMTGNHIANSTGGTQRVSQQRTCEYVSDGSQRVSAYNVVYEFQGQQATVRMMRDPGPTVRVAVTAVPN